ncbi:MAG: MerR family DNA-binding transcriptional regulator [Synechococcaceae cyanobacterium]
MAPALQRGSAPPHPQAQPAARLQRIGEVARRSGLTVKTIRFYSDQGLIEPQGRSEGGYRLFCESVYDELALIRTLRALDIPLAETGELLRARRSGLCTCSSLQATIRKRLAAIERTIGDLGRLRGELGALLHDWQDCGGRKPA